MQMLQQYEANYIQITSLVTQVILAHVKNLLLQGVPFEKSQKEMDVAL